ncbi:MAG: hypothetical protein WB762_20315 [Candidatus Sulfotelmatobacter sp.]
MVKSSIVTLEASTPTVLEADIYAAAALAAGVVVVIGYELHYPAFLMMTVSALLCVWLRVMAISEDGICPDASPRPVWISLSPMRITYSFRHL